MEYRQDLPSSMGFDVEIASSIHYRHAASIAWAILAEVRGGAIGMAARSREWILAAMESGHALVAMERDRWVGFSSIHPWEGGRFVSTSGLIVRRAHRGRGVARKLKEVALRLSGEKYPGAACFGLSTSQEIWRINQSLGFASVPYSQITRDPEFWAGCKTCPHHARLRANAGRSCLCRAVLRPPPRG